jgi:SAM-dependent methyltransferase
MSQAYQRKASYADYQIDLDKTYYKRIRQEVSRFCGQAPAEKKLLDIACFDGRLASQFIPEWDVYGVEGDKQACERARENRIKILNHDLDRGLPYPDSRFDCVIAAEIIEHVYDTDFFLREIHRVLKAGGILVLSTPNIACLTNRIKMLFGRYPRYAEYRAGGAGHIRVYTAPAIRDQIRANGFTVLRYIGCNFPMPMHNRRIPGWLKKLAVWAGDWTPTLAGQVIITAKK